MFAFSGMMTGFTGCDYNYANYSNFVSSYDNHAAEVRPDLCPEGEYGYDPRSVSIAFQTVRASLLLLLSYRAVNSQVPPLV